MSAAGTVRREARPLVVGVGDMKVSSDPEEVLVTYALGSCIALILYDPEKKAAGMLHYMLPLSKTSPEKAASNPAMFADTGIPPYSRRCSAWDAERSTWWSRPPGEGPSRTRRGSSI